MTYSNGRKKIKCTAAFLTWNSEDFLRRTLESVKDFEEIIFIDGGSTDDTLAIAKEYGVKVVSQSNPGCPITSFAKERQIGLEASTHDWHLWLDSDDVISSELCEVIRQVIDAKESPISEYWVRQQRVRPSDLKEYKTFFTSYQPRLIKRVQGAHFERVMHERVVFTGVITSGYIEAPWIVLLGAEKFDFTWFKPKAWERVPALIASSQNVSFKKFIKAGIYKPLRGIGKYTVQLVLNHICYGSDAMPPQYELFKMYYFWVRMRVHWVRYIKSWIR